MRAEEWNRTVAVGDAVDWLWDNGEIQPTTTRGKAITLPSGLDVVGIDYLDAHRMVLLSHLRPAMETK